MFIKDKGNNFFHPNSRIWSVLIRGTLQRINIQNIIIKYTFTKNQISGGIGQGPAQPPKNKMVATAAPAKPLIYSDIKKNMNLILSLIHI